MIGLLPEEDLYQARDDSTMGYVPLHLTILTLGVKCKMSAEMVQPACQIMAFTIK